MIIDVLDAEARGFTGRLDYMPGLIPGEGAVHAEGRLRYHYQPDFRDRRRKHADIRFPGR